MAEHVNNFLNGLHKDNQPAYQPEGTYRDLKNFQLVNHDGNNWAFEDALGNRLIFEIPRRYNATTAAFDEYPMPIGFISFVDKIIVFSTNSESLNGGYGEIGRLYLTNFGQSADYETQTINVAPSTFVYTGYVPIYNHEDLNLSKQYKIEGFSFAENEVTQRVYWTDYFNQPRVLDVNASFLTDYKTPGAGNPLVSGEEYMVVTGAITHNAVVYGPGLTAGNIFTAVSAVYTVTAGQPLVIPYYDVTLLDFAPNTTLGKIQFNSFGSGSKYCGNKMYFHRLFDSLSGIYTSWSFGCFPIHVGKDQTTTPHMNSQHYYVGAGSDTTLVNSGKSVLVDIDNIDTKYDVIELACAEFDQKNEIIRQITIVVKDTITGTSMTLEDFGTNNLGTLTLDDITLFPANVLKCKTMTTNKNYMLVGNISEREDFDEIDFGTPTYSEVAYEMPIDGDRSATPLGVNFLTFGGVNPAINPSVGANPGLNEIEHAKRYVVISGTAEYPAASGIFYAVGEVFVGDFALANYKNWAGVAQIRPCVSLSKYNPVNNTSQRNNVIEIETYTGWDYRNPAVAHLAKGYRAGEKYRFGILFFDKRRNPFYVRWLDDYTFDDIDAKGGLLKNRGVTTDWFCLNPHLFKIDGLRIPKDVVDKIDGFSIVRAECDQTIITQGLAWQTQVESSGGTSIIHPLPLLTLNAQGHAADPTDHVYSFICPDDMVAHEPVRQRAFAQLGDILRVASWIAPLTYTGANYTYVQYGNIATGAQTIASKLYTYVAPTDTAYDNESTVTNYSRLNEGDKVVSFLPGNDFYNSDSWVGAPGADTATYDGMTASVKKDADNYIFIGGKKIIVKTVDDLDNYDKSSKYSNTINANGTNPYKCLVNYIIPNANQYGGTSDEAKAATLYISTGHYQQIDSQVIADNYVGASVNNYNYLQFDDIWVGGGDCFTCMIDHGYGLYDSSYGPGVPFPPTLSGAGYAVMFPCECGVNFNLRRGRKVSDYGMQEQSNGVTYSGGGGSNIGPEDYAYNDGYSSDGDPFTYPALPVNYKNIGRFPYRIRFAGEKFPGELVDSYRTFLTNDYKDVDGQLGEINNLRSREGKTYYWQNNGIGYVPILERQTVSAMAGEATTLGTGGVVDRFDTISAFYGNQHQHGLTETKDGYIWFDMRHKDMVVMSSGGGVDEITSPLGLKSFFGEVFLERLTEIYSGTYLNSPTFDITSDRPLMGTGIIGVYDPKSKTSYLTFKFRSYFERDEVAEYDDYQVISKDFTIAFNHVINKFVGFYDKTPAIWHLHNQFVLSANNPKNLNVYYGSDMVVPTSFTLGDVIASGTGEYVCTTTGTVSVYAATPSSLFTLINRTNQIYIENEEKSYTIIRDGYQRDTFYGRVVNNLLEVVVNPKTSEPVVFDNIVQSSNDVNFTDVEVSTSDQTASDLSIASYDRNYQYTDKSWRSSVPLSSTGRLVDFYMKIVFTKKNWTTVPTTLVRNVKVISFIKTLFRLSK